MIKKHSKKKIGSKEPSLATKLKSNLHFLETNGKLP
jgi:hypothetical protein